VLFCGKYMTDCRGQFPASWFAHATLEDAAWGAAREVKPKFVSRSDPAAQWTGALKGHAFFAYATNYLIDFDHAVIINVEVCRAIRQAEVGASRTMIDRTQDRFSRSNSSMTTKRILISAQPANCCGSDRRPIECRARWSMTIASYATAPASWTAMSGH